MAPVLLARQGIQFWGALAEVAPSAEQRIPMSGESFWSSQTKYSDGVKLRMPPCLSFLFPAHLECLRKTVAILIRMNILNYHGNGQGCETFFGGKQGHWMWDVSYFSSATLPFSLTHPMAPQRMRRWTIFPWQSHWYILENHRKTIGKP